MAYFPRKYWDAAAGEWDGTVANKNFPHFFYYYEADLYISDLLANSRCCLELGAGTCGSTINHASSERRIVAIDYSPGMLRTGRDKVQTAGLKEYVDLVVADQSNLPFRENSFDSVFSRGVALSYATDPYQMITQVYRVLKDHGLLGLDFMNELSARR